MANRLTMETVTDFYFLGLQNHCGWWHEIKRHLLLGRKINMLDSILKSRDITLPTKVHLVKAMVFPVVRYGCENWTIKKAECLKIDIFELWYWRRLLKVPWKEIKPVNPKGNLPCIFIGRMNEISLNSDWCWSWSSSSLATWCEQLTHWKRPWCWEGLRAGEGGGRGWDGWMALLTQWTWVSTNSRR